jgi:DNA-binding NarL/FixJ family response regulator
MTQRITVLLVGDHRLLREGIAAMLSEAPEPCESRCE